MLLLKDSGGGSMSHLSTEMAHDGVQGSCETVSPATLPHMCTMSARHGSQAGVGPVNGACWEANLQQLLPGGALDCARPQSHKPWTLQEGRWKHRPRCF